MKPIALLARLAWLMPLAPVAASAQSASAAMQSGQPTEEEIDASRIAIGEIDFDRLYEDRDYAGRILRHLEVLDRSTDDPEDAVAIDTLRLAALGTLEQHDQIRAVVDRVLTYRSTDPEPYRAAWWAALSIPDHQRAVAVVAEASRRVPGVRWAELRESLGEVAPALLLSRLAQEDDDGSKVRLAEALFRIGWVGDGGEESTDRLRMILLDHRLEQGNAAAASDLAAGLTTPGSILSLIVMRRYDPLVRPDSDRLARLRTALADYDRLTLQALGDRSHHGRIFDRAQYLRSVGREQEALDLLEPFTRDVPATVAAHHLGMWLINEAAYALIRVGRHDDAVTLMQRLVALPVAEQVDLIGPYINHSVVLLEAGRPAEALADATAQERDFGRFANDYGKMWIAASIVCSLAALDRAAEAGPALERLRTGYDDNAAALTRAYLCLNDLDAAEAVVIRRLQGDDPESMVLALQAYQLPAASASGLDPVFERLRRIGERPAVRAALERVGHVLELPLSRTYWGVV